MEKDRDSKRRYRRSDPARARRDFARRYGGYAALAARAAHPDIRAARALYAVHRARRDVLGLQAHGPLDVPRARQGRMNDHDDIVREAAFGDDDALAQLVRAYHDRVYRFGLRACRDAFDAEDAVQEAFVKLARRPDVQRDRGALAWLMTTVKHACLRLLRPFARQRRLGERVDAEEAEDGAPSPERALERWRLVELVHRAIAKLPSEHRQVL